MLDWGWFILAAATFVGLGYMAVAPANPHRSAARFFFALAAATMLTKIAWWGANTSMPAIQRIVIIAIAGAVIATLFAEGWRYVGQLPSKEATPSLPPEGPAKPAPPPPPPPPPKDGTDLAKPNAGGDHAVTDRDEPPFVDPGTNPAPPTPPPSPQPQAQAQANESLDELKAKIILRERELKQLKDAQGDADGASVQYRAVLLDAQSDKLADLGGTQITFTLLRPPREAMESAIKRAGEIDPAVLTERATIKLQPTPIVAKGLGDTGRRFEKDQNADFIEALRYNSDRLYDMTQIISRAVHRKAVELDTAKGTYEGRIDVLGRR